MEGVPTLLAKITVVGGGREKVTRSWAFRDLWAAKSRNEHDHVTLLGAPSPAEHEDGDRARPATPREQRTATHRGRRGSPPES